MIQLVTTKGETVWKENQLIPIFRNGQIEDVYWTFSYSPVKDASENVAGVLVICSDNTKRLKAVADLEESEKRFREVADLSPYLDMDNRCRCQRGVCQSGIARLHRY